MAKNIVINETLNKLGLDAYLKRPDKVEFSAQDLDKMVKTAIADASGGKWNFAGFMKNRYDVFAVIASVMPASIRASLEGQFNQFADFRDEMMGEKTSFQVTDNDLFKIYTTARGNQDIDRQTIFNKKFSVQTVMRSVAIYAELDEMMAGRVDFTGMVNKVAKSFAHEIGILISDAIYGAYAAIGTTWKATGSFDDAVLDGIIKNVKAATGSATVEIYGDSSALGSISTGVKWSEKAMNEYNDFGYVGAYKGTRMISLPQAYRQGTTTLAVDSSFLLILPAGEKITKVVMEGIPLVTMEEPNTSNDMQPEFFFGRRIGVAAITVEAGQFGFYKLT